MIFFFYRVDRIITWRTFLIVTASLILLPACSTQQPRSATPHQGSPPPLADGTPSSPPSNANFAQSVLQGSDRPGASPLDLIQNSQVKKELDLTETQSAKLQQIEEKLKSQSQSSFTNLNLEKLDAQAREQKLLALSAQIEKQSQASQKEVASILQPEQLKRLKEITLQLYGWGVLTSSQFTQELQITSQQQQQLKELRQQMLRQISQNWPIPENDTPEAQQTAREVFRQTMDRITRQSNQQAFAVLTPEQQKMIDTLKGRKFELDPAQMPNAGPPPPGEAPPS